MSHSAVTLLTALYEPTDLILFRPVETYAESGRKRSRVDFGNVCYRPANSTTLEQTMIRLLESSETERTNLFFGVCPRLGDKGRFDLAWQIRVIRCLWADLDECDVTQAAERCASQSIPVPTAIVNSGNGVHLYWLLDQPFLIDDAGDPPPVETEWSIGSDGRKKPRRFVLDGNDRIYIDGRHHLTKASPKALLAQDMLAGIAGAIGGDHTTDLTRLLRLPGTLNRKDQRSGRDPVPAELVDCDASRKYSIDAFHSLAKSCKVSERQRQIVAIPSPPTGDCPTVVLSDDEIIELACNKPKTGEKFRSLWEGRWIDCFNSASEADSSLVFFLAYYTKDAHQLDGLFRQSGLMRPKWDEMHGNETYGATTIDKALGKVTKQYKSRPKRNKSRRPVPPAPANAGLPAIIIDDRQLGDLTAQAMAAIKRANSPPSTFVRSGALVRVVYDENNIPKIEPLDVARVRCRLTEVANFFTMRKSDGGYIQVGTNPPKTLAENILVQEDLALPPLAGVARAPILRADGTICTTPGYDPTSRLMYRPDSSLNLEPIPEYPCGEEVRACVDILLKVIEDFPFVDDAGRANSMATLFSILMRPVIKGHIPLAIFDAPMQGTGKSLLITSLATIAVGKVASESIPTKKNEDEWRKKVTSILMTSASFVLLDNIPDNTTIDSPVLAATLTSREVSDRLLGGNRMVSFPSRTVWAASGNNLRVTGDMPRRSYSIRLDANVEKPWQRSGFEIHELEQYIDENRGRLLSAAFTIIRAWYTNGKPMVAAPILGSYQEWANTVGSVLAFAGIPGFLTNREQTQDVQDESLQEWIAFFEAWWERFGKQTISADDICDIVMPSQDTPVDCIKEPIVLALPGPLLFNRQQGGGSFKRSLGRHLSRLRGRVFNGRKLTDAGVNKKNHTRLWQLVELKAPPTTLFDLEGGHADE